MTKKELLDGIVAVAGMMAAPSSTCRDSTYVVCPSLKKYSDMLFEMARNEREEGREE